MPSATIATLANSYSLPVIPQSLTPGYHVAQFSRNSISGCHPSTCLDPLACFRAAMLSSCRLPLPLPLLLPLPLELPLPWPVPDLIAPSNVHNPLQHARLLSFTLSQFTLQQSSVMFFRALMILPCYPSTGPILQCPIGGGERA